MKHPQGVPVRPIERHDFLVPIPAEPPRPLTARVWLAWLVHSEWTRATLYLAILPAFLGTFYRETVVRTLREDQTFGQVFMALLFIAPVATTLGAIVQSFTFASLVSRGVRVIAHARGVRAETALAGTQKGGRFLVTDTGFEYQGGRDGVNIQGKWDGRIRYMRQPAEGQAMPILFDSKDPSRRLLLWQFGLTTSLADPEHRAGAHQP
jgi:hypothetical protein